MDTQPPSGKQFDYIHNVVVSIKKTHMAKILFVLVLIILSNLAFVAAFYIVFGTGFWNLPANNFQAYVLSIPFISLGALVGNDLFRLTRFYHRTRVEMLLQVGKYAIFEILVTSTSAFALRAFAFPRSVFLVGMFLMFAFTAIWEMVGICLISRFYAASPAIFIGSCEKEAESTLLKLGGSLDKYGIAIKAKAFGDDIDYLTQAIAPYPEVMIDSSVDEVVKSRLMLVASLAGKVIHLIPQYSELALYNAKLLHLNDTLTFFIDRVALTFEQRMIKRLFDLLFSFIVIILTSPIMLACWIAIRIDSPGPGVFRQQRVTLNGKRFFMLKFRTMFMDAETETGPVISTKDDPRVTKVGRFLRRAKLDELPQFFNVIKGEMSVVGPRSERPFFVRQYAKDITGYTQRFKVRAGITGYAQIAGNYDTAPGDKLRFDLIYIRNYSILQDIKIILDTVRMILTPRLYNVVFIDKVHELAERQRAKSENGHDPDNT